MKIVVLVARIVLGLVFFVLGGLNGLFQFMPPPELPPEAGAFMGAMADTGYFLPLLKVTELITGALLLIGIWVPLALVVLAPIVLQILFFHAALAPDPAGLGMAVLIVVLTAFLAWAYRGSFRGVLARGAKPAV